MSSQKEFMQWQQERAKELFSLSHRLLETAKEFGDHQATEIKASMEYAKSFAKQAATNDLAKLKDLQEKFSDEASTRVAAYQKKIKGLLKDLENETAEEVDKHINKAKSAMESWLKEASKNFPEGSDKFTHVMRDIANAGDKVLKEGRKMAKQAAETAEQGFANLEKMKPAAKSSPAKKAPAKEAAAKKTVTRKTRK